MDIAKRIIYLRELKGLSTNKLADRAGISQSFLRDIEHENKRPSVRTLSEICDALGISLKDFFDDGTIEDPIDDALLREIYKLTPEQKEKLTEFLKLI